jgi:hypothetical protein
VENQSSYSYRKQSPDRNSCLRHQLSPRFYCVYLTLAPPLAPIRLQQQFIKKISETQLRRDAGIMISASLVFLFPLFPSCLRSTERHLDVLRNTSDTRSPILETSLNIRLPILEPRSHHILLALNLRNSSPIQKILSFKNLKSKSPRTPKQSAILI